MRLQRIVMLAGLATVIGADLQTPRLLAKNKAKDRAENTMTPLERLLSLPDPNSLDPTHGTSPGSTYSSFGPLASLTSDFRATQIGDLLTIIVDDQASAVASGNTSSKRQSSANASVSSIFKPTDPLGSLANLARLSGQQQLDGQGATTRQTTLSTTLSARVIRVQPNGDLIVEGSKLIAVNSEHQSVVLRGIVRPVDLGPGNLVRSNRVADLEVKINGKGVVNDAIRRPNFLYRLFLGILPF